jgi:hypothetical protein
LQATVLEIFIIIIIVLCCPVLRSATRPLFSLIVIDDDEEGREKKNGQKNTVPGVKGGKYDIDAADSADTGGLRYLSR